MSMLARLTDTLDFQAAALQLRSARQQQIASNIANADTPGYIAREVDFSSALRAARQSQGGGAAAGPGGLVMARASGQSSASGMTAPGHMALGTAGTSLDGARRPYTLTSQNNLDGNAVDMDRERASFADNALRYEAALRSLQGSTRGLVDAMKPYNQG